MVNIEQIVQKNFKSNLTCLIIKGKLQVKWPGLNTNVINKEYMAVKMEIIGVDEEREKRLKEVRDDMEKLNKKRKSCPPHERGFTSATIKGKSIEPPVSYDDGNTKIELILSVFWH